MSQKLATLYPEHLRVIKERHDRALAESKFDSVVIYGGSQHMIFLDDMPYPFKVNPHFKSWAPLLDNPHCFVHYTPGEKPRLLYYQPVDFWHKAAGDPEGFWVEHFEITPVASPDDALQHLQITPRTALIGETDGFVGKWNGEWNPQPLVDHLHFQRAWKTEYEIECMREANRGGARGHRAAERSFRAGSSEYEIHLDYMRATLHTEAELPYGNIIALNENAAVLHYQHQSRSRPASVHSFLIDAGTQHNGYASDITRTYSNGDGEFQSLIDGMEALQLELVAMVRPGVDYKEIHFAAHRKIGALLHRSGFIDIDGDAAFEKRITSTFFPHGVGHYIGLQVHDVAGFMSDSHGTTIAKPEGHPFLRLTRKVEERQVFTIEPGLYFIDSLLAELRKSDSARHVNWEKVEAFRKFGGIRIEDDVVVRADAPENLTRAAFASIDSLQE